MVSEPNGVSVRFLWAEAHSGARPLLVRSVLRFVRCWWVLCGGPWFSVIVREQTNRLRDADCGSIYTVCSIPFILFCCLLGLWACLGSWVANFIIMHPFFTLQELCWIVADFLCRLIFFWLVWSDCAFVKIDSIWGVGWNCHFKTVVSKQWHKDCAVLWVQVLQTSHRHSEKSILPISRLNKLTSVLKSQSEHMAYLTGDLGYENSTVFSQTHSNSRRVNQFRAKSSSLYCTGRATWSN